MWVSGLTGNHHRRTWVGRGDRKNGAGSDYIQLVIHREDGVVLPFKENLEEQHDIEDWSKKVFFVANQSQLIGW